MDFNEPLIRTQQDSQDAYAVDLQARDEAEVEAVIEAIDDQLKAMDDSNSTCSPTGDASANPLERV